MQQTTTASNSALMCLCTGKGWQAQKDHLSLKHYTGDLAMVGERVLGVFDEPQMNNDHGSLINTLRLALMHITILISFVN